MDASIEIIGEIIPEKRSDFEVIYDGSTSNTTLQDTPVMVLNQRPIRTRRPIKTLMEEQDEDDKKPKRSVQRRPRRLLRQSIDKKPPSFSPSVKKAIVKPKPIKSVKRKADEACVAQEKRPTKTSRTEVGGAGTIKHRKNVSRGDVEIIFEWDPAQMVAECQHVEEWQAKNVINMFDSENTLPFIARYRKEKTGNLEAEKLREIQNTYSQLKHVQEKVVKILKAENSVKIPQEHKAALLRATTLPEVEHLMSAFKGSSKRTYAERAKELGLEGPALEILYWKTQKYVTKHQLSFLLDSSKEGLRTIDEVEQGLQHIIADVISKNPQVLDFVKNLMRNCKPSLECSRKRQQVRGKVSNKQSSGPSPDLCAKYELYFNFNNVAWATRPHQILAMNRGENQNVLTVKVGIPEAAYRQFLNFCMHQWLGPSSPQHYQYQLIIKSIEDSWERLVKPFMQRQVRSQLTEMASIASVEVFTSNLKKLLLTPPVRGKCVLAVDPGFHNGCKIGVVNIQGDVLLTTTIYPFRGKQITLEHWDKDHNARTLREIVHKYRCEYFALGNGTACRQMEQYLSWLITASCFEPYSVQYTIINESGVSQYSVAPEAKSEFPNLDPNHISAVSLARRLQDPLLEYVKVHPMHLGVGMYQHDIPERLLHASLDSVMTECVSFVGVDINVASEFVLRKLSGLNKTRAANIVEYRKNKGPFMNRDQLKSVKGIGPKTFEQCAGFVRIMPATLQAVIEKTPMIKKRAEKESICPLDRTTIHPESYDIALNYMNLACVRGQDIGSEAFVKKVQQLSINSSLESMAKQFNTSIQTMQLIIEGLCQSLDFDIRAQFEKPLFRKEITSMDNLIIGTRLTGTVRNTTHFGAFVDIGVGTDGLIHQSCMQGMRVELGTLVEVTVRSLDKARGRIGLALEKLL